MTPKVNRDIHNNKTTSAASSTLHKTGSRKRLTFLTQIFVEIQKKWSHFYHFIEYCDTFSTYLGCMIDHNQNYLHYEVYISLKSRLNFSDSERANQSQKFLYHEKILNYLHST